MTRPPYLYAFGRGFDADAGGAAELQTDVMRFMAILSLCLVAIFALVQSLPPKPITIETPTVAEALPAPDIEEKLQLPAPAPASEIVAGEAAERLAALTRSAPVVASRTPVKTPEPAATEKIQAPPLRSSREGHTLQFEDDAALTRLISRNEVGFFAISPDRTMRLAIEGNTMNFWPSSTPAQFHEMDASTVPVEVKRALLRSAAALNGAPAWGVTLPPSTTGQLRKILAETSGGSLVIGSNGELRLEP